MHPPLERNDLETSVERIKGSLYEVIKGRDDEDKVLRIFQDPMKVKIKLRNMLEIIVGSSILAALVMFTVAVWKMDDDRGFSSILELYGNRFVELTKAKTLWNL
jgi:hypothetical protein